MELLWVCSRDSDIHECRGFYWNSYFEYKYDCISGLAKINWIISWLVDYSFHWDFDTLSSVKKIRIWVKFQAIDSYLIWGT